MSLESLQERITDTRRQVRELKAQEALMIFSWAVILLTILTLALLFNASQGIRDAIHGILTGI